MLAPVCLIKLPKCVTHKFLRLLVTCRVVLLYLIEKYIKYLVWSIIRKIKRVMTNGGGRVNSNLIADNIEFLRQRGSSTAQNDKTERGI